MIHRDADAKAFWFGKGARLAGVVCVGVEPTGDPLAAVMASDQPARLLAFRGSKSDE